MAMQKHIFCCLLMVLGLSACIAGGSGGNNINLHQCSPATLGGECLTTLDNLIPGQSNVGEYVINMKKDGTLAKFIKKCNDGELDDDLFKRGSDYANPDDGGQTGISAPQGIAGVVAPDGKIMLFNGHHHTYALYKLAKLVESRDKSIDLEKCNYSDKRVYVHISDNYYNPRFTQDLPLSDAYKYMIDRLIFERRVWLKDVDYQQISFESLPRNFLAMGNDRYRSLIKLIQEHRCNKGKKKNPEIKWQQLIDGDSIEPFVEFTWGEKLRAMKIKELDYDPYQLLPYDYDPNTKTCKTKTKKGVCTDLAEELTVEAYNYINKHYADFKGFPGYNYKAQSEAFSCEKE